MLKEKRICVEGSELAVGLEAAQPRPCPPLNRVHQVRCSFLEIYNEGLEDLLIEVPPVSWQRQRSQSPPAASSVWYHERRPTLTHTPMLVFAGQKAEKDGGADACRSQEAWLRVQGADRGGRRPGRGKALRDVALGLLCLVSCASAPCESTELTADQPRLLSLVFGIARRRKTTALPR